MYIRNFLIKVLFLRWCWNNNMQKSCRFFFITECSLHGHAGANIMLGIEHGWDSLRETLQNVTRNRSVVTSNLYFQVIKIRNKKNFRIHEKSKTICENPLIEASIGWTLRRLRIIPLTFSISDFGLAKTFAIFPSRMHYHGTPSIFAHTTAEGLIICWQIARTAANQTKSGPAVNLVLRCWWK